MVGTLIRILRRSQVLLRGGLIFVAASTLVNGANFFYHLIVSRRLGTEDYGALGAMLGLLLIFSVPAAALQVAVTKEVAKRRASAGEPLPVEIGPLLAQSLIWGIGSTVLLLVLSPLVQAFLHLDSVSSAILLALYAIPSALGVVPRGVLLGEMRFSLVAVSMAVGSIVRLGFGAYLSVNNGLPGALAAILLGDLVGVAILLPALRKIVGGSNSHHPLEIHWKEGMSAIVAFSGFWALTGIDTLLARHFLERSFSGYFAAAATVARAAMFLPAAIASLAFPRFAVNGGRSGQARTTLVRTLAIVGALGFSMAVFLTVFSEPVVKLLFGEKYLDATSVIMPMALSAAALGVVSVLMHFHIATNARLAATLPWLGVGLALIGILVFHNSMTQIATVMIVVDALLLALMLHIAFGRKDNHSGVEWVERQLWDSQKADMDLTMVVPFFNPGPEVVSTIKRLDAALSESGVTYEIIAVSDGSTDGSSELLQAETILTLRTVVLERNMGKGHALRLGLAMGRGQYLGFIDADGDLDPALLAPYLSIVKLYQPDIVLGSKRHPMSEVQYPPLRHVYSWGYQALTYLLFRTRVRDTQTGLKLVRREVLAAVLPLMVEKRFAFDLELLVVARHLGFTKFFEAPVRVEFQFKSTVSIHSVRGMLLDTIAIFYRLNLLRTYDTRLDPSEASSSSKPG